MKKIILVGAVVCATVGAFVACNSGNDVPTTGCLCTVRVGGSTGENFIDVAEMAKYWGVTTCSALAAAMEKESAEEGADVSYSCSAQ